MRRKPLVIIIAMCAMATACFAQDAEESATEQQVSPPPISAASINAKVTDVNMRLMYMSLMEDLKGGGFNMAIQQGLTEDFALGASFGMMGFSGSIDTGYGGDVDMTMMMMPFGGNVILEVFGGHEIDAVGQITARHPTLAVFGGVQLMLMTYTVDVDMGRYSTTVSDADASASLQAGAVVDLPLGSWLSVMPYAYVQAGEQSSTSFGADILLRPFGNQGNWQISLGTVLQQVDANDDDTTMIMIGIAQTTGANFSRTKVGPVLQ